MTQTKTSSGLDLLVELRRHDLEPLHRQLERELRNAVRSGRLVAGDALPSSRTLASELGLSRGVVVEAYEQLVAEGYLVSRQGGATRVSRAGAAPAPAPAPEPPPEFDIAFRYGRPDVSEFPREVWLRSVRRVLARAPSDRLSYIDGRGMPELRTALAAYLNRVRGTCADPERMVICGGFAQGLSLVSQVLHAAGGRQIALEDPSDDTPRTIAARAGLEVVPVEVDDAGLDVDALSATDADAVVVTAAHQFPRGGVLPPDRRARLVGWATPGRRLLVEDDYDAEYRYDREPIGAIQGLAPDRVVYIGSASKTLAPGLRLGWMLLPADLVEPMAAAKYAADRGSPAIDQLAFADFVAHGELDRHLRRMRPIYRRRRDALLAALGEHLPQLTPIGASAGLHLLAWLPAGLTEAAAIEAAAGVGVGIEGVGTYRIARRARPQGLIFGYAGLSERAITEGIRRLGQALDGNLRTRSP
jgi:GntR family transcriptional regulator / MocR family aminotransferase